MSEGLLVSKIREGTVIDHIPAGRALQVLRILGITGREGNRIAIVMNVDSRKLGRKDIVKVEGRFLSPIEYSKIALAAPTATVNIIRDYRVAEKHRVEPPEEVEGLLKCVNPTCISRKPGEPVVSRFRRIPAKRLRYQCVYCGSILDEEDILAQLAQG